MRTALIALIVCGVMISTFAMTSVASAEIGILTPNGNSPTNKVSIEEGGLHGILNLKDYHTTVHIEPGRTLGPFTGPLNQNSKNPNDNGVHPVPPAP